MPKLESQVREHRPKKDRGALAIQYEHAPRLVHSMPAHTSISAMLSG